ncbi:MAG: glycosyltransferase family 2 protein [bacterium]
MTMTLVIPAKNEARFLPLVLRKTHAALPPESVLVLSDSASTDATPEVVQKLLSELPNLRYFRVAEPGKGMAIKAAWRAFPSDIVAFMDADLATDLEALNRLKKAATEVDVVIGNRRSKNSLSKRSLLRKTVSYGFYRIFRHHFPSLKCSDTTCGFKAIRNDKFKQVEPKIKNTTFFFDTELIIHSFLANFSIQELAINWDENRLVNRVSSVRILKVAQEYLANLRRASRDTRN